MPGGDELSAPSLFPELDECPAIGITSQLHASLRGGAAVAIGVSGGKDSCAVALKTVECLEGLGHTGPVVLIHSDLGRVEWRDSLPTCERLAARLGLELIVVRRQSGDLLQRWQTRWERNVARYVNLECVKLILPWSTPSMRFCTSELKTAIITRELRRRFAGRDVVNVVGIRRDESSGRAKTPFVRENTNLVKGDCFGFDWHPIADWTRDHVFDYLAEQDFALHEAYTRFGSSRVSCAFCIMGSGADLRAAAGCQDNADVYRAMVDLEIASTFAFQGEKWLADVAPHLLAPSALSAVALAKERAKARQESEAVIPSHLLYTKGWPTCVPDLEEARMLANVRREVGAFVGLDVRHTTAARVQARYRELMDAKETKA